MDKDDSSPDTNAAAEVLWQLARQNASMEVLLCTAKKEARVVPRMMSALMGAFDIRLGKAKVLVDSWDGVGGQLSAEEIERREGAQLRAALRPKPRRLRWTKLPTGGWAGRPEESEG